MIPLCCGKLFALAVMEDPIMRSNWMLLGVSWAISMNLFISALQAGPNQEVCRQIVFACLDAGFVQGGAKRGNGLWRNCISPIMLGKGLQAAAMPLPPVNPRVVSACRASNPTFGQPKLARERYASQGNVRPTNPAKNSSEITRPDKKPAVPLVPKESGPTVGTSEIAPKTDQDVMTVTQSDPGKLGGTATRKHAVVADQAVAPSSSESPSHPPTSPAPVDLNEATQTAALDSKKDISSTPSPFGIAIGSVEKQDALHTLWRDMLNKHAALVVGLQARSMLGSDKKWQLIAGPLGSKAEAAQLCRLFKKENLDCEATAFEGDAL
jgi:hypothetical protein